MSANKAEADFDELRESISTRFRDQLKSAVEGALRAADDVLFDWAYTQSLKNKTTQDCIDLMRMLRLRRESFVETFLEHFDRGAPSPEEQKRDAGGEFKLELKSDEQQELECAVQNFISTVTNHSDSLHGDLLRRLAVIDPEADPHEKKPKRGLSWRMSTEHVAETFREAAARLEMEPGMQIVLFKLFERCATPALSAGYALIDRDLTAAGVVAPREVNDDEDTAEQEQRPQSFMEEAAAAAQAAAHYNAQPFGVGQSGMAQQFAQQLAGMPGAPGHWGGSGQGAFVGAHVQLAQQFAQLHTQRLDQLLGGYAAMAPSREQARNVLQPMVMPLMRLSAAQPELLADPRHRIRGLLDQALAEGASPTRDEQTARILEELQDVIARLAETVDLPRDLAHQQRRIPDEEAVSESLGESRRLRSQRTLERARRFASEEIEQLIARRAFVAGGNAWMRTVMVPYLAWVWAGKGERTQAMQQARGLLEDLSALLEPKTAIAMHDEMEAVVERGAQMLRGAGAKLLALNRIMVRLRQLYAKAREAGVSLDELMGDQRFQDRDAPPPEATAAPPETGFAPTGKQAAEDEAPGGQDSWLAGQLRVGDWWRIAISASDRPLFARLESSARRGEDLHFSPIDERGIERIAWEALKGSVMAGRSRPLHPAPGFGSYVRRHAA
jgi:hypothetical protein